MPHVALISGTALTARNGSSKVELRLARELTTLGFDVTLLTRDTETLTSEPFTHVIYQRPSSRDWMSWLRAGQVADSMRGASIDLVHAFHLGPPAYYAQRLGKPYVLTHHDMRIDLRPWRNRRVIEAARHVVALNEAQAAIFGPEKTTVIPNGVGGSEEAPSYVEPGFIFFAGRFEAQKGVFLLLDAYARIPSRERPRLLLAGDGKERSAVQARAGELGATVLPWLAHDALLGTLGRAAKLVIPSSTEASPLLLLEAYLKGVPVVVHDLPMIAADLRDPDGSPRATLIELGDKRAWATALVEAPDPALAIRAQAAARARTWPSVAARYADVYRRVLAS